MFPILNSRGAVIGFGGRVLGEGEPKYMNSPETPLFEKGREVYGLVQARDPIRTAGRVLVVEGYMDVVALAQFDVGYAVATLGTATTPVHVAKLLKLADELVFSFDGDAAGRKAAWRALEVCLPLAPDHKPVRFLFLPDGEDPDTYIRKQGKEAFEKLAREAQPLSQFLLGELASQSDLATPEGRAGFIALAKPHIQKLTAPALRIQLVNAVAELGKVSDYEIRQLMEMPEAQRFRRPAPARVSSSTHRSNEWSLLYSLLVDLPMIVHIEPSLLRTDLPESQALLAIREIWDAELSVGQLVDRLEGNPSLSAVLDANRYGEELGLTGEEAKLEFQGALGKLDVLRRKTELDRLLGGGLRSKDDLAAYNAKLKTYNQLRGATANESRAQA
jgi:DNA primase